MKQILFKTDIKKPNSLHVKGGSLNKTYNILYGSKLPGYFLVTSASKGNFCIYVMLFNEEIGWEIGLGPLDPSLEMKDIPAKIAMYKEAPDGFCYIVGIPEDSTIVGADQFAE